MLKRMKRNLLNAHATLKRDCGFTTVQIIVTLAIIGIASTFAVVAIGHSRAAMRLSASERELAAYLEQARTDSIRRHATAPVNAGDPDLRAKVSVRANGETTYTVTMDFDKDGVLDAPRTISLQSGVTFSGVANTVVFDWRGRTPGEISIGLINERGSTSNINITGSGDITLNTDVFQDDDIPAVVLNGNASGDVIVDSAVNNGTSNSSTGSTNTSTGSTNTSTGSTNTSTGSTNTSTGSTNTSTGSTNTSTGSTNTSTGSTNTSTGSTNTSTGSTNTSTGSTNTSTGSTNTSTGSTTSQPCALSVSTTSVDLAENGGTSISVTLVNLTSSTVITASPSNSGQIQVSPTTRTLTSSGSASFNITVKKQDGSVRFTTSPNCGSATTSLNVD